MSEEKNILTAEEADRLLGAADGTAALLFLYIRRNGGFAPAAAARELKRTEAEIVLAAKTLRRLGLLEPLRAPEEKREIPEYTAEDIARRAQQDRGFTGIVSEAEHALGRVLSSNDLRLLFGMYDHLGLPPEVIMLLLHHCVEEYQERNGAGRMPTMRYVEKEAWYWAEQEILDLDAAEEHLRLEKQRRELVGQVKEAMQIRGRELTVTERKYIENWIAMGYGPDALAVAYDRTVLSTGKLAWKYMDRIVQSWNEKRLYTPGEIEKGDVRAAQGARRPAAAPAQSDRDDKDKMERLRRVAERLNGREG